MLARPELEQLAQRVIARYHLRALSEAETAQYIRHRLEVCGLERPLPFDRAALRRIHALAGGVPRRINLLCDRALLGAYAGGQATVTRQIAARAAAEVFPARAGAAWPWRRTALAAGLGLAAGAGLLAAVTRVTEEPARPAPALRSAPAVPAAAAAAPTASQAEVALPVAPPLAAASARAVPPVLLHDEKQAWRELAEAWQVAPGEGEPCAALAREQVQCFSRKLNLALIRQLARPGIVTLDAPTGRPSYAILTGLTEQSATLRAAGSEQVVTLAALAARWDGDFATLWRAPAGYRDRFADGQAGPSIDWVAQRLDSAKGVTPRSGPQKLNASLRAEVRAFQLAQGLPADGQPGPMTFMQLNRASGVDEPRLRMEP
jgi:general secretion pathway protein A